MGRNNAMTINPTTTARNTIITTSMAKQDTQKNEKEETVKKGREFRGVVVSSKMKDTVSVAVERYVKHSKYKKFLS